LTALFQHYSALPRASSLATTDAPNSNAVALERFRMNLPEMCILVPWLPPYVENGGLKHPNWLDFPLYKTADPAEISIVQGIIEGNRLYKVMGPLLAEFMKEALLNEA
jgi:hypothetical protein